MDGNNFNDYNVDYTDATYEAPVQQESQGNGFSIASLVLGILGVTCLNGWLIPQILAIVFGRIAKKKGQNAGMATAGFWLGIVGIVLTVITYVIVFIYYGAVIALMLSEM